MNAGILNIHYTVITSDEIIADNCAQRYTIWSNGTKPGVVYKVCMRDIGIVNADISRTTDTAATAAATAAAGRGTNGAIGTDDVDYDVEREWSAVTLFVERE